MSYEENQKWVDRTEELLAGIQRIAESLGHSKPVIRQKMALVHGALAELLSDVPRFSLPSESTQITILPIQSLEYREFVERNYPLLKPGSAILFPQAMQHPGSGLSSDVYHSALVERIVTQFENGHVHTAFFSVLRNEKTSEVLRDSEGQLATATVNMFGWTNIDTSRLKR